MPNHLPSRSSPPRWRSRALVAAALSLASVTAHAQPSDSESARALGQAAISSRPPLGGPTQAGSSMSRVTIGNLKPSYQTTDITLKGTLADISLTRHFSFDFEAWRLMDPQIQGPLNGAPFGLGLVTQGSNSIYWWHNFFSYVDVRPEVQYYDHGLEEEVYYPGVWAVREPGGGAYTFDPCASGFTTPCMASPQLAYATRLTGSDAELQWDGTGFVLHKRGKGRFVFRHFFSQDDFSVFQRVRDTYYLTEIQDLAGRTLATLTYAPGSTQVSEVLLPEGSRLRFHYQLRDWESVLAWVGVVDTQNNETEAVRYDYLDGRKGLLSASKRPNGAGGYRDLVIYGYGDPATYAPGNRWMVNAGGAFVDQIMGWWGTAISSDKDADGTRIISGQNVNPQRNCPPGALEYDPGLYGCDWRQYQRLSRALASNGSGSALPQGVTLKQEYLVEMEQTGPVVRSRSESCVGDGCNQMPARTWSWDWTRIGPQKEPVTLWQKGPTAEYTRYAYALDGQGHPEVASIHEGAWDVNGSGALRTRDFTYVNGAASGQYVERFLHEELRPSTLVAGQKSRVIQRHDAQNRLKATFKTGYTQVLQGSTWATVPRVTGTFYFTRQVCAGSSAEDPLGRVVEVHGPCEVGSTNDTDCPAGVKVPVTQLDYYPANATANKAHRLSQVRSFVDATASSCLASPSLGTTYTAYDARGRALESVDANGTLSRFVFDGDRLVRTERGDGPGAMRVAEYGYDDAAQKPLWIKRPTGEYEVTCYRKDTSRATGCVGGTVSHQLQWKALSPSPTGANWTEAERYTYQDGRVVSRTLVDSIDHPRQVSRFDADAFGRPTFEQQGQGIHAPVTRRSFDAGDHLQQLGLPHNAAPEFCLVDPEGTYRPCALLAHDRLGRQTELLEFPKRTTELGVWSCLDYDARGNVSRSVSGCTTVCPVCLNDPATYPVTEYRHDDFDQLVQVTAPWFTKPDGTSRGSVRMEYDARGNIVRRQLPSHGASKYERYTHDMLGREREAAGVTPYSTEVWSTSVYDGFTADADCPTIGNPHRRGRLVSRVDGEGKTCFSYDEDGAVTRADRVLRPADRVNDVTPFVGASTGQTFDAAGRLLQQKYPDGRRVYYTYWGASSRLKTISADLRNPDGTTTVTELLRNIQWGPGGRLLSYEIVAMKAAPGSQSVVVEYLQSGIDDVSATESCAMAKPSWSDDSGLVGGVWVSRGATGAGDVYKAKYKWKYGQLERQAECVLNTGSQQAARVRSYVTPAGALGYDATLKLTHAPERDWEGQTRPHSYSYDARGNRISDTYDLFNRFSYTYPPFGPATPADRLGTRKTATGERYEWTYNYDADGRETSRIGSGWDDYLETYPEFDPERVEYVWTGTGLVPGRSSTNVISTLDVGYDDWSVSYRYFYDSSGRRVRKHYEVTGGTADELFWSGTALLEDRGNAKMGFAPAEARTFPIDQYIWLDGRPVVMIKAEVTGGSKSAPSFARKADFQGSCTRNGEASQCGVYFLVVDPLGRPVLMLNGAGKVAGTGEYDPFGHVNREPRNLSSHPYTGDLQSHGDVGAIAVDDVPGLQTEVRARMPYVDVEPSDMLLVHKSYTHLRGGHTFGRKWGPDKTSWYTNEPGLMMSLETYDPGVGPEPAWGVKVDRIEYRRHEAGVTPVWTRLRLPGQYYDPETDMFDNWHRTYDPSTGRFTSPDPLLLSPEYVAQNLARARVPHAYAYAGSNPIAFADPTGLATTEMDKAIEQLEKKLSELVAEANELDEVIAEHVDEVNNPSGIKELDDGAKRGLEELQEVRAGVRKEVERTRGELRDLKVARAKVRGVVDGGSKSPGKPNGRFNPKVVKSFAAVAAVGALLGSGSAQAASGSANATADDHERVRDIIARQDSKGWDAMVREDAKKAMDMGDATRAAAIGAAKGEYPWALDSVDSKF